jgi:hypothetical protein
MLNSIMAVISRHQTVQPVEAHGNLSSVADASLVPSFNPLNATPGAVGSSSTRSYPRFPLGDDIFNHEVGGEPYRMGNNLHPNQHLHSSDSGFGTASVLTFDGNAEGVGTVGEFLEGPLPQSMNALSVHFETEVSAMPLDTTGPMLGLSGSISPTFGLFIQTTPEPPSMAYEENGEQ